MASENATVLLYVKLTQNALPLKRESSRAAGLDLRSAYDAIISASGNVLVKTDIAVRLPPGSYGRIAPCSGLALQYQIDVGGGVIDEDNRGNICIILHTHSKNLSNLSR
jgi:dUTP pyrophosphatase